MSSSATIVARRREDFRLEHAAERLAEARGETIRRVAAGRSNSRRPASTPCEEHTSTSVRTTLPPSVPCALEVLADRAGGGASSSTNDARAAPRESASIPSAPGARVEIEDGEVVDVARAC